jgi:DNA-binding NtrC family response regulator
MIGDLQRMDRILIVDDERAARIGLKRALGRGCFEVQEASDGRSALQLLTEFQPHVLILDLNMPVLDGMSVLRALSDQDRDFAIIVLTAYGSEQIAVKAMKSGAYDYLTKPYDVEELRLTVRKALETVSLRRENHVLRSELEERRRDSLGALVGKSSAMQQVYHIIDRTAELNVSVLIRGESGTGKELVARAIHEGSERCKKPFIAINCAALPDALIESELFGHRKGAFTGANSDRQGKFELADGGTVLLDEIGDMNVEIQAKLLRILEQQVVEPLGSSQAIKVNVRVIAATHQNLDQAIKDGKFRHDLYYRLKVVDFKLPALSERREDIPLLVDHFVEFFCHKHKRPKLDFSPRALQTLQQQSWPGNVRELKNLIEGAFVMCSSQQIDVDDLPLDLEPKHSKHFFDLPPDLYQRPFADARKIFVQTFERDFVQRYLKINKGNISKTAQALGMHRQSLQQKIKELGIHVGQYKDK